MIQQVEAKMNCVINPHSTASRSTFFLKYGRWLIYSDRFKE